MAVSAYTFLGSGFTLDHVIISLKNGMLVHLNRHLSLLSFILACLHILNMLLSVASWCLPMSLNPSMRMSSAIPNTFGSPGTAHPSFSGTYLQLVHTLSGSHIYLYLPKGQEKVVRYDDCSPSFKLWYPELALMGMSTLQILYMLLSDHCFCGGMTMLWFAGYLSSCRRP